MKAYYSSGMTTIESEEFKKTDELVTGIEKSYEIQFPRGNKWDIMMLLVEVMEEDLDDVKNPFTEKCICDWSKDDEFGFIPNTICSVHGKATKESLKEAVPIRKNGRTY